MSEEFDDSSSGSENELDNVLPGLFTGQFQKLLDQFDQLRSLMAHSVSTELPAVCVFGDQSHGKSSLLELISGVDLPKGKNMKTKVPLELQLRRINNKVDEQKEAYATICMYRSGSGGGLTPAERIELHEIADKVDALTEELVGTGMNVLDRPIVLTVYRPDVVDLTLIDLPGLIRNSPVDGLPEAVLKMTKRYMKNESTIILNVMSCFTDGETCESLKLSGEVDRKRQRTLLAYTFVDMHMDMGLPAKYNNLIDVHKVPRDQLYLVRNRKEEENNEGVSIAEVREKELEFFGDMSNAYISNVPMAYRGSSRLQEKLAEMQKNAVLESIPRLVLWAEQEHKQLLLAKKEIGNMLVDTKEKEREFSSVVEQFHTRIKAGVEGDLEFWDISGEKLCLCSAARRFCEEFRVRVDTVKPMWEFISEDFFAKVLSCHNKTRGGQTLPDKIHPKIANMMIADLLVALKEPCHDLRERVFSMMDINLKREIDKLFSQYRKLKKSAEHSASALCATYSERCAAEIDRWLERERIWPFTMNSTYFRTIESIHETIRQAEGQSVSQRGSSLRAQTIQQHRQHTASMVKVAGFPLRQAAAVAPADGSDDGKQQSVEEVKQSEVQPQVQLLPSATDRSALNGLYVQSRTVDSCLRYSHVDNAKLEMFLSRHNNQWEFRLDDVHICFEQVVAHGSGSGVKVYGVCSGALATRDSEMLKLMGHAMIYCREGARYPHYIVHEAVRIASYWKIVTDRVADIVSHCVLDQLLYSFVTIEHRNLFREKVFESVKGANREVKIEKLMAASKKRREMFERNADGLERMAKFKDVLRKIQAMYA